MNKVVRKTVDFFKEVWRRNVFHIAIPYGVASWGLIQVADVVFPTFDIPDVVTKYLIIALVVGFPVAIVIAWIFDITPKGLVRTTDQDKEEEQEPEPAPALSLELGDSERRRVTMLNCMVRIDSMEDDELDPEDLAVVLTGIENIYQAIVDQYKGFRLPGQPEELSIVFGYPSAHDDDARRAVATGLAVLEKIKAAKFPGVDEDEVSIFAHAAVHSGLVVVDDSMTDGEGTSIIGRVPNVTSWLRTVAPADALVASQETHRLVSSYFQSEDLGSHELAQLGGKLDVFRIDCAVQPDDNRADQKHESTILFGHDREVSLLEDRWENVVDGRGQFVLMKGEPGIGKSIVKRAFLKHVKQRGNAWVVPWYCSPYEKNSEFYPVIQCLKNLWFRFVTEDSNQQKLEKIEHMLQQQSVDMKAAVPLIANLMSVELPDDSDYELSSATSQLLRNRTMELMISMINAAATDKPVLLVIDGLQWIDPSTREMLEMILDHGPSQGVFVLMTARPEFQAEWRKRSYIMEIDLHSLSHRASRELVQKIAAEVELPEGLIKRIVDETDGVPMFIEEMTLAILELDVLRNGQQLSAEDLARIRIPATMQESLAARVDKLGSAKALLQVCSMLGREFSYRLLLAVSDTGNEEALQEQLDRIVKAEMLFKRRSGAEITYTFKHILIQETAYESLLKSTRKKLHARIAEILQQKFPETATQYPQRLAYHFGAGGMVEKAIEYWTVAGRRSVLRSANLEAIEQARSGLKLLKKLPDSSLRNEMEVPLQSVLGTALLASQGYTAPEVGAVFTRARELCEQIDNAEQLFQIVVGLWMYYVVSARFEEALEIASQLKRIAKAEGNAVQLVQAHYSLGYTQYFGGNFTASRKEFETAISHEVEGSDHSSQSASADDTRTHVRCMLAHVFWHLGQPETASRYAVEAWDLAQSLGQPYAITYISFWNGWFHQIRREPAPAAVYANECVRLAEENGYRFFIPLGRFVQAWADNRPSKTGSITDNAAGAIKMKASMEASLEGGIGIGITYLMFQLAEEYLELNLLDEAMEQLHTGWKHLKKVGEYFLESEYLRLRGRLCMARQDKSKDQSDLDEATEFLTEALSCAKMKQSKGLELRAATDLALALSQQGKSKVAADTISSVIDSFEEFDKSGDCTRAREVLKILR